ncbi:cupredoxin domain-containing protein [Oligoflexus tunisiensis]|uniref:cupredoxin domain-containing protein n=1 Tax=Oligoflexus tunisiensis TaxID=708132 RepID=UPI00114CF35C|nr:plastocyanin/azurin family copper-binding protein [Oligoflexus tunisiensis]
MRWAAPYYLAIALAAGTLAGSSSSQAEPKGTVHHVKIKNMVFDPPVVKAKAGDQIIWTNEDIFPHTVTSQQFDSGGIASGKTWTVTLKGFDEISYKCSYHPTMVAHIRK